MTIKDVSEKFQITQDTLRYYERVGMIPPVTRTAGGIRDYQETCMGGTGGVHEKCGAASGGDDRVCKAVSGRRHHDPGKIPAAGGAERGAAGAEGPDRRYIKPS